MSFRVACSSCGRTLHVRDDLIGKKARCPNCRYVFVAAAQGSVRPAAAAAGKTSAPRVQPAVETPKPPRDEEDLERRPAPEAVGPYQILEAVGRGGAATVYKARHKTDGTIVAVKVGHQFLALEPDTTERFKREFTSMRALRHPHLVATLDYGETDDVPYLVLEFVGGGSLEQRLKKKGPLPLAEAVAIFAQVADGLQFLHGHQILHRDIKPANILLGDDGQAKLTDFGLFRNLLAETRITRTRQSMGTMEYGAPEQFENAKDADSRCDIYSFAAAFYTALTGQFPFGAGGHLKILKRKLLNQFVPLRQLAPALPADLDGLISRALQAERVARPESMDEVAAALRAAGAAPGAAPEAPVDAAPGKRGSDRRATIRAASGLPAAFVPFHESKRGSWNATILNVSTGGLLLQATKPYPVGAVLEVDLRGRGASYLVQVRWVQTSSEQDHTLGCAFVHPLPPAEVDQMLTPPS